MNESNKILIDENNALFDKTGMLFKEFPSDFRQIRYFTLLIVQKAPLEIKGINLLEQQISELIKNAIKHGNKNDTNKKIKVWYNFTVDIAHLIIEDEGSGFKELDKWNDFNKKRNYFFLNKNFDEMANYVSFRSENSDESDGGNALFAALEYWNKGIVFNNKKNSIAVQKLFSKNFTGINLFDIG